MPRCENDEHPFCTRRYSFCGTSASFSAVRCAHRESETLEAPLSVANLCLIGKYRHPHLMGVHLPSFRLSLFGRVERRSDNTLFQNIVASEGSRSSAVLPTFRPSWNHGRSKSPGREFPKRVASIDSWALTHCTMSWTMDILSPRLPLLSNSELQQMRTQ